MGRRAQGTAVNRRRSNDLCWCGSRRKLKR
ncbi:MAG: hypothetical protein GEV08_05625 [Acidimicrobiia bacterium]|nr:hypothetical protein [Acidimicrobiia bacterium]